MNMTTILTNGLSLPQTGRRAAGTALSLLLLLALPAVAPAQFSYTTDYRTIAITGYTGPGGDVTIPSTIDGLPVTCIEWWAFWDNLNLTNVTIPDGVTKIGWAAFRGCSSLVSINIPNGVQEIEGETFVNCSSLANITIPNSVTQLGGSAFACCGLTSITIPDSVTCMGTCVFMGCLNLTNLILGKSITDIMDIAFCGTRITSVVIPNTVTNIGRSAFEGCSSLTGVTIGTNVDTIGITAFASCTNLTVVYCQGNAPSIDPTAFANDNSATVYYLPGTTGWGATLGGRPTALWDPPTIRTPPRSQTAEENSPVSLRLKASGERPLVCLWYLNGTNLLSWGTNCWLLLTNLQSDRAGAYTAVISNSFGAITSSPAILQVIAPVERRPAARVKLMGQVGSSFRLDCANSLSPSAQWSTLGSVSLTNTSQDYFDVSDPLPPLRVYRAWQTANSALRPTLELQVVPAITLRGSVGTSLRIDYINQYGPTNAWVTLDTVTLTNASQLYFDTSSIGQPARLWRLVPVP
jgi:hypothetical protein